MMWVMTLLILDMFMKSYANVISKIDSDVTVPITRPFFASTTV